MFAVMYFHGLRINKRLQCIVGIRQFRERKQKIITQQYSNLEEKLNVWSHAFGIFLSIIALVLLIIKAVEKEKMKKISSSIFT